jgi:hypothetical protein
MSPVEDFTSMKQIADYPHNLKRIVDEIIYRPGWAFVLDDLDRGQGSEGLTFQVCSKGYDTYHPDRGETYRVWHYFPVPPAAYNDRSWKRWILERLIEIETHEVCEFLQIDGKRPFAPNHGPGHDPYFVRELNEIEDAETTFRGERREGSQS